MFVGLNWLIVHYKYKSIWQIDTSLPSNPIMSLKPFLVDKWYAPPHSMSQTLLRIQIAMIWYARLPEERVDGQPQHTPSKVYQSQYVEENRAETQEDSGFRASVA